MCPPKDGASGSSLFKPPPSVAEVRKAQTDELLAKLGGRAELPTQAVKRIVRTVRCCVKNTVDRRTVAEKHFIILTIYVRCVLFFFVLGVWFSVFGRSVFGLCISGVDF